MVQTLCQDDVALYVSQCCADIERNRSKKGGFFLQETMACIHGPSLYVWMSAVVGAVLIAYDCECAKELSEQKQAFLASWLCALCICMYKIIRLVINGNSQDFLTFSCGICLVNQTLRKGLVSSLQCMILCLPHTFLFSG